MHNSPIETFQELCVFTTEKGRSPGTLSLCFWTLMIGLTKTRWHKPTRGFAETGRLRSPEAFQTRALTFSNKRREAELPWIEDFGHRDLGDFEPHRSKPEFVPVWLTVLRNDWHSQTRFVSAGRAVARVCSHHPRDFCQENIEHHKWHLLTDVAKVSVYHSKTMVSLGSCIHRAQALT